MNNLLTLTSQGDNVLNKIFTGQPYLLNIEGSINICMTLCGQEIDGCSVVHFANMRNIGKVLVMSPDTKKAYKCSIKLAYDSSSDNTGSSGIGNYTLEKVMFSTPSLHKMNNTVYDGEIYTIYSSTQKNGEKLYVVLCSFLQGVDTVQTNDWRFVSYRLLNELFGDITKIPLLNQTNAIGSPPNPIDVNHFLPREGFRNFYEYTHPSNNMVNFRIFQTPLYISKQAIQNLQTQLLPGTEYTNFKQMVQSYINPPQGIFIFFSQDMTRNVDSAMNGQLLNPNTCIEPLKTSEKPKPLNNKKKTTKKKPIKKKSSTKKKSSGKKKPSTKKKPSSKKKKKEKFEGFSNYEDSDSEYDSERENFENQYDSDEEVSEALENEDEEEDFENEEEVSEALENEDEEDFENEDEDEDEDEDFENEDEDEEEDNKVKRKKEKFENDEVDNGSFKTSYIKNVKKRNVFVGVFFTLTSIYFPLAFYFFKNNFSFIAQIILLAFYLVGISSPFIVKNEDYKDLTDKTALYFRNIGLTIFFAVIYYGLVKIGKINNYSNVYYLVSFVLLFSILGFVFKYVDAEGNVKKEKVNEDKLNTVKVRRAENVVSLSLGFFVVVPLMIFIFSNKILNNPSFKSTGQMKFDANKAIEAFKNNYFKEVLSTKISFYFFLIIEILFAIIVFFNLLIGNVTLSTNSLVLFACINFFVLLYYIFRYINGRLNLKLSDLTYTQLDTYNVFNMGIQPNQLLSLIFNPTGTIINTSQLTLYESSSNNSSSTTQQGGSLTTDKPIPGELNPVNKIIKILDSEEDNSNNLLYLYNNVSKSTIFMTILFILFILVLIILLIILLIHHFTSQLNIGMGSIIGTFIIFILTIAYFILSIKQTFEGINNNIKTRSEQLETNQEFTLQMIPNSPNSPNSPNLTNFTNEAAEKYETEVSKLRNKKPKNYVNTSSPNTTRR